MADPEQRNDEIRERVQQILTSEEEILALATQKRPLSNIAPDTAVLTNRRFIVYRPHILGRADFEDYIWRDLRDAVLKEGYLAATLSMTTVDSGELKITWLRKEDGRRVYAVAQEQEELVREERRYRDMEEQRAAAGGVVVHGSSQKYGVQQQPESENHTEQLRQLKEMLDGELITQEEYDAKKKQILDEM